MKAKEVVRILSDHYDGEDEIAMGWWIDENRIKYLASEIGYEISSEKIDILISALQNKMCDRRREMEQMFEVNNLIEVLGEKKNE